MTNRVHSLQRFRRLTGPLTLFLSMLLLLPLLATACGETSGPEVTGRVVEKEVVREVVVTPETPPGRELAQQMHEGETYTLVEYDDRLAVFTDSGSPVTDPGLANDVLRSYAWRQTVQGLDTRAMSDEVAVVQGVDSSLSNVREASNEMVVVFDELDSLSTDVPLLGRVSAMDVLAETYPGMGAAADAIRTLDDELNSIGRDTVLLSGTLEHITTLDPSGVSGDDIESLFQDAAEASDDMEARARSARSRVAEVLNVARDLEDALWQASGTPVIGENIGEAAGITGVFAAELSNLAGLLQGYVDALGSLAGRFQGPIEVADSTQRAYVSRWLQVPYDDTWRSVSGRQPAAAPTSVPPIRPTDAPFRIEWETSESTVEAGESFTLTVRMYDVQEQGEHGGISVSFPAVFEPGGSTGSYSSVSADVDVIDYTSGLSNVTFHLPGATIYHRENNRQFPAEYLLVESDDPSWSTTDDRTLVLRVTPKIHGDFPVQIRGWLCADEYTGCSRQPSSGQLVDQQGWRVESLTLNVTTASPAPDQSVAQVTAPAAPAPGSGEAPFRLEWETSAPTVDAGESFSLTVRMHDVQEAGEHGGISVSFPSLTESGGSTDGYSSAVANVEAIHYETGLSNVAFHQPGATIYHRENNRQFPAGYLLVESDDPSWSRSTDRTLVLRITPKRVGEFPIQIRGWLCSDEYTDCTRSPAAGTTIDQQGHSIEVITVPVKTDTKSGLGVGSGETSMGWQGMGGGISGASSSSEGVCGVSSSLGGGAYIRVAGTQSKTIQRL